MDNEVLFLGDKVENHPCIISYVKVTKYLRQRCQEFLASVVEAESESKELDSFSVRVVSEYLDIFPKELPSASPSKGMEFSIDLLPGTTPISNALTEWHMPSCNNSRFS